jgi:HD superfamily phosphodiesterase
MKENGRDQQGVDLTNVNPSHIITVESFSVDVMRSLVAHLEASTDFEHLIYREAELDAVWSLTDFYLLDEDDVEKRKAVELLHLCVHRAHDLVASGQPKAAAAILRAFC